MTWVRFLQDGKVNWGRLADNHIQVYVGSPLDEDGTCRPHSGVERLPLEGTTLLPPCQPTKIVCVGRNYVDHAKEQGDKKPNTENPVLFLKPPSALIGHRANIRLPRLSQETGFEGELGVVIKRRCFQLGPDVDIRPYILGFTCLNDVSARDLQKTDRQWTRGKGFDTFCPVGPWAVEAPGSNPEAPWDGLQVQTRVNGELRQDGNTRDFIFPLPAVLQAITAFMTLEPGDLIATGTPAGVGLLKAGDRVEISIAGIGTLENGVVAEA